MMRVGDVGRLRAAERRFTRRSVGLPRSWQELIDAGFVAGTPVDPPGRPCVVEVAAGTMALAPGSVPLPASRLPPAR